MKIIRLSFLIYLFSLSCAQAATTEEMVNNGNMLWSEGKITEAESQFKDILKKSPNSSIAHSRLAGLYLTQNRSGDAINEYQNAIMNDPENAGLFIGISIAYLHNQRYSMAQSMVEQALKIDPSLANAQKLKKYIDAKNDVLAKTTIPNDALHGSVSSNPHAKSNQQLPDSIKQHLKK